MMKVGLLTTWDEPCGIAEYSKNLVNSCTKTTFDILHRDHWTLQSLRAAKVDIIHVNHEPGLFRWLNAADIRQLKSEGKKTVLTWHTSIAGDNSSDFANAFDRVVVHEQTSEGYTLIPHGITVMDEVSDPEWDVGWAGFPFPWKGIDIVTKAAELTGLKALLMIPESRHCDAPSVANTMRQLNPSATIITEYQSVKVVQERLSKCRCSAFPYEGNSTGISGAVRLGIGTKQPVIVTDHRQFRDLHAYEDEIWFMPERTPECLASMIELAMKRTKLPKRILEEMSWSRSAAAYEQLYCEVLNLMPQT